VTAAHGRRATDHPLVLAVVHQRDAGPGVFADAVLEVARLETWMPGAREGPSRDPGDYDAVLSLGGAMHPDQGDGNPWLAEERVFLAGLLESGNPLLGVCLGAQLLSEAAGAGARRAGRPEIGWHPVALTAAGASDPLLGPLAPGFEAFQWHSYEFTLPTGAVALAESGCCLQAWRRGAAWALQFHAEVAAADARAWIDDWESDEDAVRSGLDPARLRKETDAKIASFNSLGAELCRRWLRVAGIGPEGR
jgi:GMP synthase-like glutamine amidotransferase